MAYQQCLGLLASVHRDNLHSATPAVRRAFASFHFRPFPKMRGEENHHHASRWAVTIFLPVLCIPLFALGLQYSILFFSDCMDSSFFRPFCRQGNQFLENNAADGRFYQWRAGPSRPTDVKLISLFCRARLLTTPSKPVILHLQSKGRWRTPAEMRRNAVLSLEPDPGNAGVGMRLHRTYCRIPAPCGCAANFLCPSAGTSRR